ncbi:hypothetical protein BsWGS_13198 [Bradybaena similaris]
MTTRAKKKPIGWYTSEIQQMMFSFGDCRQPLQETAELVEVIVHQQMTALLEQASDVAISRRDKHIGIEHILFLLRKDKNKLKRLFRFFEKQDIKNKIKTLAKPEVDLDSNDLISISVLDKEAADKQKMSKERKTCLDFLSSIDQTGELLALFYDQEEDTVKHERMLRAETQSKDMSMEQYFEFCKARQVGFSHCTKQFQDWIMLNFTPVVKLKKTTIDVLCYLARETVAEIVDLALLVKQDLRAHSENKDLQVSSEAPSNIQAAVSNSAIKVHTESPYKRFKATTDSLQIPLNDASNASQIKSCTSTIQTSSTLTPSKLDSMKSGPQMDAHTSRDCAILPSDVREAMRRYYTDISPFVSQTKVSHHCSTWHRTVCS